MSILGPVSEKSQKLFGPEKPFLKLWPTYSEKLVFSCCKGNKNKNNCKVSCLETPLFWRYKKNNNYYVTWNAPKKVLGLSRNRPINYSFITFTVLISRFLWLTNNWYLKTTGVAFNHCKKWQFFNKDIQWLYQTINHSIYFQNSFF